MRLSAFVAVIFIPAALSCSCIDIPSREESIRGGFCYSEKVYVGTVVEATCNCFPSDDAQQANVYCKTLGPRAGGEEGVQSEVISRGSCVYGEERYYSMQMCSQVDSKFYDESDVINVDQSLPPVQNATNVMQSSCSYICPFNEDGSESGYWPCMYTVTVQEVFKGKLTHCTYTRRLYCKIDKTDTPPIQIHRSSDGKQIDFIIRPPGDVIMEIGPDIATTCSLDYQRILQYQQSYLVGIGGACTAFADWAEYDSYSTEEIMYLNSIQEKYVASPTDACSSASTLPMQVALMAISLLIYQF